MAVPKRTGQTGITNSEQTIQNTSFDIDFNVSAVEDLVYNEVTGNLDRAVQSGQTLPTTGLNPSLVLSYNVAGECIKIEKTIGSTTYTKTFTRSDNVVATTLPISVWS